DFRRVVLEVGVHGEDDVAVGRPEAGRQGRRLAEVPPEADAADPVAPPGQVGDDLPRPVGAAVVHEDDLQLEVGPLGHLDDLPVKGQEAVLLVVNGNDDRDPLAPLSPGGPGNQSPPPATTNSAAVQASRNSSTANKTAARGWPSSTRNSVRKNSRTPRPLGTSR